MLRFIRIIIPVGIFLSYTVCIAAQTQCFQFTWLGPNWNNESIFENATCSDATKLARGVPCVQPLVVSYDGSPPDVNYIWKNHPEVSCILPSDIGICAKFTYSFDGTVLNSTHFCTRAVDNLGNAINSGCHEQVNGSSSTRVCFCKSVAGGIPCNNSIVPSVNYLTVTLIAIALILQLFVNVK